jgi:predicted HNH restriction endonuclease
MRNSTNAIRAGVLASCLALGAVAGLSATAIAADSNQQAREAAYLAQIIAVMRSHVQSMRTILDQGDIKYADNMVRHAEGFERAFGMVGPMDWHAAKAFQKTRNSDRAVNLTEDHFDELADDSYRKVLGVKRAAKHYLRDKDKQQMDAAIDAMTQSCNACHSKLPKGAVPSVWSEIKG